VDFVEDNAPWLSSPSLILLGRLMTMTNEQTVIKIRTTKTDIDAVTVSQQSQTDIEF